MIVTYDVTPTQLGFSTSKHRKNLHSTPQKRERERNREKRFKIFQDASIQKNHMFMGYIT
jgi:hypothetical protein